MGDSQDGYSVASSYQQHLTQEDETTEMDEDLVIDDIPPSLENALALNQAYQAVT